MDDYHSLIRTSCRVTGSLVVALFVATTAFAQTLITVDDVFGVPFGNDLLVETPGVLGNDTYNGEPAEDCGRGRRPPGDFQLWPMGPRASNSDGSFTILTRSGLRRDRQLHLPGDRSSARLVRRR